VIADDAVAKNSYESHRRINNQYIGDWVLTGAKPYQE